MTMNAVISVSGTFRVNMTKMPTMSIRTVRKAPASCVEEKPAVQCRLSPACTMSPRSCACVIGVRQSLYVRVQAVPQLF
jgi:hypothetical protein